LFNDRREMFEYDRVGEVFATCGHLHPQGVIDVLVRAAETWREDRPLNDDITFVVLRAVSTNGDAHAI
jgi:serine phosphatase RsbU (regulator of sigma subunit)